MYYELLHGLEIFPLLPPFPQKYLSLLWKPDENHLNLDSYFTQALVKYGYTTVAKEFLTILCADFRVFDYKFLLLSVFLLQY